jgi:hypothetical protein
VLRRTHQCDRCGVAIEPGDLYAAIDGVDADGELRVLLCRSCGEAFRAFLAAGDTVRETDDGGSGGAAESETETCTRTGVESETGVASERRPTGE